QGGSSYPITGDRFNPMQENWAPATRLIAVAGGTVLMLNCLARRTPGAVLLGTAGYAIFLRGLTNLDLAHVLGFAPGRRGIEVQKTTHFKVKPDRDWNLVVHYEDYPHFMSNVHNSRKIGDGHYAVALKWPGGSSMHFEEVVTRQEPFEVVA